MSAKTYWHLLVLCGLLYLGIMGTFADKRERREDIEKSSELLVRQKRVINRDPRGDINEPIRNFPYIVAIKKFRTPDSACTGVILSNHIVLTIARCVAINILLLRVYSGSAGFLNAPGSTRNVRHTVADTRVLMNNNANRSEDGIALISVTPYFVYSVNTHYIKFYEGAIHPGLNGTVSGWGCNAQGHPGTQHPHQLRSITVPIISTHDCAALYRNSLQISDSDFCTLHPTGDQYCGVSDVGAPFVTTENGAIKLVGVNLGHGGAGNRPDPDVFVNLNYPRHKYWITRTIDILNHNLHR